MFILKIILSYTASAAIRVINDDEDNISREPRFGWLLCGKYQ